MNWLQKAEIQTCMHMHTLRVRVLKGVTVSCSWARLSTLTVPLSIQEYKWHGYRRIIRETYKQSYISCKSLGTLYFFPTHPQFSVEFYSPNLAAIFQLCHGTLFYSVSQVLLPLILGPLFWGNLGWTFNFLSTTPPTQPTNPPPPTKQKKMERW